MLLTPAQIEPKSFESRRNSFLSFFTEVVAHTINEKLKWISSLSILMQESFWW